MYQQDTGVSIHVSRESIRHRVLREEMSKCRRRVGDLHLARLARYLEGHRSHRPGSTSRNTKTS